MLVLSGFLEDQLGQVRADARFFLARGVAFFFVFRFFAVRFFFLRGGVVEGFASAMLSSSAGSAASR